METVKQTLVDIHSEMYAKALKSREENTARIDNWKDFMHALSEKKICLAPWCNIQKCEIDVKEKSKEESLQALQDA